MEYRRIALVMGRAGSQGVKGKNIREVAGKPLCYYPLRACQASSIDRVFVSTDCPVIKMTAWEFGAEVIDRPKELSRADSEMSDVILHASRDISRKYGIPEIWVTLHANCGIHKPGLIDECVAKLESDPALDSCVSARLVWDLHPYRLKRVNEHGLLVPWVKMPDDISNNRQQIRDRAVVLDGACRAFRSRCLDMRGQPPFRYLGDRIAWVENPDGLDVHCEDDIAKTEGWLIANNMALPERSEIVDAPQGGH